MNRYSMFFGILMSFSMSVLSGYARQSDADVYDTSVADDSTFYQTIERLGLQMPSADWSDKSDIRIPEPLCAYVNITGIDGLPSMKGQPMNAWMEVYDGNGNYFRKRVILDAQGSSSLMFPKKSFKADFCDDEWAGDSVPDFRIGSWVRQDGFHFKAYYTDFLRGSGTVAYKIYDLIAADRGRMWERALGSISSPNTKARCFPDGFPCWVYVNGSFHGLYAWELKKHRRNMNMEKDNPVHIHLDGTIDNSTMWQDGIDWTAFEVRNPKGLLTKDSTAYDGDNPREISDSETKRCIIDFSQACRQLEGITDEGELKARLEEHFDIGSLIDYTCFYYITANWDGFKKNWQWFTYDGRRWFVAPYDLDCTFGNFFNGNFIVPADHSGYTDFRWLPENGPFLFIHDYYLDEVFERYRELRHRNVVGPDIVKTLLSQWYERMGTSGYEREWERWPQSKCISEDVMNDGWELVEGWKGYAALPLYSDTITFVPGDRCFCDHRICQATDTVRAVRPFAQQGYQDSLERFLLWTDERFRLLDEFMGYDSLLYNVCETPRIDKATPFYYDLQGRRVGRDLQSPTGKPLRRGLYIKDGKKVVIK